jgi:voltage-gated potassium channel
MDFNTIYFVAWASLFITHMPIVHYLNKNKEKYDTIQRAFFNVHVFNLSVILIYAFSLINSSDFSLFSIIPTVVLILFVFITLIKFTLPQWIVSLYLIDTFLQTNLLYANLYKKFVDLLISNHPPISKIDLLYYSITTFTTTGYGDIYPIGNITKVLAASEMVVGYLFSTIIIALFVSNLLKMRK